MASELRARITELMTSKGLCEIRFDSNLTEEQRRQVRNIKEPRGLFSVYALQEYRLEVLSLLRRGSSHIIARLAVLERLLRADSSRYALLCDPDVALIYSIVQCIFREGFEFNEDATFILLHRDNFTKIYNKFDAEFLEWWIGMEWNSQTPCQECGKGETQEICSVCRVFLHISCGEQVGNIFKCRACNTAVGKMIHLRASFHRPVRVMDATMTRYESIVEQCVSSSPECAPLVDLSFEDQLAFICALVPDDTPDDALGGFSIKSVRAQFQEALGSAHRNGLRDVMTRHIKLLPYMDLMHPSVLRFIDSGLISDSLLDDYTKQCQWCKRRAALLNFDDKEFCSSTCIDSFQSYLDLLREAAVTERIASKDKQPSPKVPAPFVEVDECAICLEYLTVETICPCTTSDKHSFHVACWQMHLERSNRMGKFVLCPICRVRVVTEK